MRSCTIQRHWLGFVAVREGYGRQQWLCIAGACGNAVFCVLTRDDHGCLCLHVLLLPGTLVELLLSQGHLIGLHMAALGVLNTHETGFRPKAVLLS